MRVWSVRGRATSKTPIHRLFTGPRRKVEVESGGEGDVEYICLERHGDLSNPSPFLILTRLLNMDTPTSKSKPASVELDKVEEQSRRSGGGVSQTNLAVPYDGPDVPIYPSLKCRRGILAVLILSMFVDGEYCRTLNTSYS